MYVCMYVYACCLLLCQIMDKFMRNPVRILLEQKEVPLEGIQQFYVDVEKEEHKFATLCDIYEVKWTHTRTYKHAHTRTYIRTYHRLGKFHS